MKNTQYKIIALSLLVATVILFGFYKTRINPKSLITSQSSTNVQDTSLTTKITDIFSIKDDVVHVNNGRDIPIPGADSQTFKILSNGFAKDSTHIWSYGLGVYSLQGISDLASFVDLSNLFGKDKYNVYRLRTSFEGIEGNGTEGVEVLKDADVRTFQILSNTFVKDSQNVWGWWGHDLILMVHGTDVASFTILNDFFEKTNSLVYKGTNVMNGVNPATFIALDRTNVKDMAHVFDFKGDIYSKISDVKTLVSLGDGAWFKDSVHVYNGNGEILEQADPVTFISMGSSYGKDASHVFYGGGPGFVLTDMVPPKGMIVSSADAGSFVVVGEVYAKDATNIFSRGEILSNADVTTFEQIGKSPYFKDKLHIWYFGDGPNYLIMIPNADVATFTVNNDNTNQAEDAHYTYGFNGKGFFSAIPK